jgi:hypothetical protein
VVQEQCNFRRKFTAGKVQAGQQKGWKYVRCIVGIKGVVISLKNMHV